MTVNVNNFSE